MGIASISGQHLQLIALQEKPIGCHVQVILGARLVSAQKMVSRKHIYIILSKN